MNRDGPERIVVLVTGSAHGQSELTDTLAPALAAAALDLPLLVIFLGEGVSHGFIGPGDDARRQWGAVSELSGHSIRADADVLAAMADSGEGAGEVAPWIEPYAGSALGTLLSEASRVLHV